MNFNFTQSGGKGTGSYGIAGSFAYVSQDSTTVARLAEGVTITGPSVDISATSQDTNINWVGGVAVGKSLGFGVTVSINDIDRKTYAIIGSANPFTAGFDPNSIAAYPAPSALTNLAVTDYVKVNAKSDGWLGAFSVAAAVADGNPKPPTTTQTGSTGAAGAPTGQNNQPTSAIGLSGNVSFNRVTDHVQAFVYDAGTMQANQVEVTAFNNTGLYAIGGAVAFAKAAPGKTSVGLAGAAGWNEVGGNTKAYLYGQGAGQKLTLTANGLRVDAQSDGNIFAITAGGSGAMGGQTNVSLAGSFSYNEISRATASFVEGVNATLNGGGGAQPALLTSASQVQTSSTSLDTIVFENSLDWVTGTAVKYDNGGGSSIAGLNTTATYYVVVDATNPKRLRLASDSAGNNLININPSGAIGEGHRLYLASTPTNTTAIDLGSEHGWVSGDAVVYSNGDGKAIGGLEDGETYYVIKISDTQLRLAASSGGSAIVMDFTKATGGQHSLHRKASDGNSYSLFEFTPAEEQAFALFQVEAKDTITLGRAHGFIAGQALTYDNGGGTSLGGLTQGGTYYAIVDGGSPTSFRLAASKEEPN
ncbi:MAG: hypothetical protein HC929_19045 [Leptolyngbyaceae cyanobacterium SM2_5_2]|nr:hypothetical protein [Leptolyngbyaceae cyanobacterium SM2_5_2]